MEQRNIQNQRTGLIVVSVLLFLSLVGNVILLVRNSRLADARDQAMARIETTTAQWEQQTQEVQTLQNTIQALRTERAELETELTAEIQSRDARIAQLTRRANTIDQDRQAVVDRNEELEERVSNLEADYQAALDELEETRGQLQERQQIGETMTDSIAMARPLQAYNIYSLTKNNRWLCPDRYNVDRARRVDETHISLEVAGTVFSPQGTRQVYLVMTNPEGQIIRPNEDQVFENQETGQSMPYTDQTQIDFTDQPVPVNFVVEHDQRLEAGEYQLQVFIDGRLTRTTTMSLE